MNNQQTHIISLGAGVQSSTMALMAALGEIDPMPTAAIFADTQGEPRSVYDWLDWLESELPFPVHRVTAGDLAVDSLELITSKGGQLYAKTYLPVFTRDETGTIGKIRRRSCTADYKIEPIRKLQRQLGEVKRGEKEIRVVSWIGISLDEATRMKPAHDPWVENRWPLIELRMHRRDCLDWMQAHGYPTPPRSACVYCPFHNDHEWRRLRDEEPDAFAAAVEFERRLQETKAASNNFRTTPFLHRSLVTLDKVDLSTPEDRGQLNLFENECEGMCGV